MCIHISNSLLSHGFKHPRDYIIFYLSLRLSSPLCFILRHSKKYRYYSGLPSAWLLTAYGSSPEVGSGCGLCRRRRHSPHPLPTWVSRRRRREVLNSYKIPKSSRRKSEKSESLLTDAVSII